MDFLQTSDGPCPAFSIALVTVMALESTVPLARGKARAWLDAYRLLRDSGIPDPQARAAAIAGWHSVS